MGRLLKPLLFPIVLCACGIFMLLYWWTSPQGLEAYWDIFSYTLSITTVFIVFYARFLWSICPWERTPRLAKHYNATIKYCYKGMSERKSASVSIKQTLLSVSVRILTNQIESNTTCSNLVSENGRLVLYYTYETEPNGVGNDDNPKARGTCRIPIEARGWFRPKATMALKGTYWTTRRTTGDIFLEEREGESF